MSRDPQESHVTNFGGGEKLGNSIIFWTRNNIKYIERIIIIKKKEIIHLKGYTIKVWCCF